MWKTCKLQVNNEQNDHDYACKSQKALMLEAQEIVGYRPQKWRLQSIEEPVSVANGLWPVDTAGWP